MKQPAASLLAVLLVATVLTACAKHANPPPDTAPPVTPPASTAPTVPPPQSDTGSPSTSAPADTQSPTPDNTANPPPR